MISDYIYYIQTEDIEKLTSIMSVDDLLYEEQQSKQIIKNHKLYFDNLDDLKFDYVGNFNFEITDKANKSHIIHILYGDGLMGISDELAPKSP